SQLVDNHKKGLGYNVVPLPLTGLFAPPTIDLSHSGIEKFKEPEFEGYGVKVDKCVRKTSPKSEKKTVVPTIPKVDVVRPKQQEKPVRKTISIPVNTRDMLMIKNKLNQCGTTQKG
ncbi:hypothetical protein Tco_0292575, partial [Tanacetum coccineum]